MEEEEEKLPSLGSCKWKFTIIATEVTQRLPSGDWLLALLLLQELGQKLLRKELERNTWRKCRTNSQKVNCWKAE